MTAPPTTLTNNVLFTPEGCASIADASGNLLFYTDGMSVINSNHNLMANGNGLLGNASPVQSSLIIKKPGNSQQYFIFTLAGGAGASSTVGLCYSVVDMSLSAGLGSVTVKNASLYPSTCMEGLTGTRHCNGVDYWIVIHERTQSGFNNNFRSYLLTSSGVSSVAVLSTVGNLMFWDTHIGSLKISPNGTKLGSVRMGSSGGDAAIFDFNNTSGVVSNPLVIGPYDSYGCEFSPNSSKFYFSCGNILRQYDLCTGLTMSFTIPSPPNGSHSLQLSKNGKIYMACYGSGNLAISSIDNPNLAGAASNFNVLSQSISPNWSTMGLPNFMGSDFNPRPTASPPFTYTISNSLGCQSATFNAPPIAQNFKVIGCAPNGYSLTNLVWNFGDPSSGAANSATVANPSHVYSAAGTYTPMLILYYSCGGGTDTIRQVINVQPCIGVQSQSITCASLGSATVSSINGTGPLTYTWMPSNQTGSVATGLNPGTHTIYYNDANTNLTYTQTVNFIPLIPLSGILANTGSLTCHATNTATASVINLSGGSGNQTYFWSNGVNSYTNPSPNNLTAGQWSVTVTDALTACQINSVFTITQPPALTLNIAASSPTSCAGTSISFTASNSGGTPGAGPAYSYTWVGGPNTSTLSAVQNTAGNYVYTVNSSDGNNCLSTQTIAVDFVPNPTLSVSDVSICPLEVGTLSVSGAGSYTWQASTPLSLRQPKLG